MTAELIAPPIATDGRPFQLTRGEWAGFRLSPQDAALAQSTATMLPQLRQRLDLGTISAISHAVDTYEAGNFCTAGIFLIGERTRDAVEYYFYQGLAARSIKLPGAHDLVTYGLVSGIIEPNLLPRAVHKAVPEGLRGTADMLIHHVGRDSLDRIVRQSSLTTAHVRSISELVASRAISLQLHERWLDRIASAVAEMAGEPDAQRGHPASAYGLTDKELAVFQLLAHGKNTKGVGEMLGIAEHTVKNRVLSILHKLKVDHRINAIRKGLAEGIVHLS